MKKKLIKVENQGGLSPYDYDPYLALQAAIIEQATEDYFKALFFENKKHKNELEKFFTSKWGNKLCLGRGEYVMQRIKKEVEQVNAHIVKHEGRRWYTDIEATPERNEVLNLYPSYSTIKNGYYAPMSIGVLKMYYERLTAKGLLKEVSK